MRISIDQDDPGFDTWRRLGAPYGRVRVLLDGVEQSDVVTADEEAGLVIVLARDEQGKHLVDYDRKVVVRSEKRGVVSIGITDHAGDGTESV